ncbi:hypothetical protein [Kitasatospora aureofaciens]|uniref:hypothetical protein n=1 Tax=Kitasatospora aureofaciens TaxID=1894 RepID=UPI0036F4AC38
MSKPRCSADHGRSPVHQRRPVAPQRVQAPAHHGRHLLVTTRQDALVGRRDQPALLDHYPRMAPSVLDAAGHKPQVECAETVRGLVGHWLDGIARPH